MGAAIFRGDEDHIETRGAMCKLGMLTQEDFGGNGNPSLLARHNCVGSFAVRFAALHFDKGQMVPAHGHKIDLAAFGFVALSQNAVVLAFEKPSRPGLGCDTGGVGGWGATMLRGHDSCSLSFNAKL